MMMNNNYWCSIIFSPLVYRIFALAAVLTLVSFQILVVDSLATDAICLASSTIQDTSNFFIYPITAYLSAHGASLNTAATVSCIASEFDSLAKVHQCPLNQHICPLMRQNIMDAYLNYTKRMFEYPPVCFIRKQ